MFEVGALKKYRYYRNIDLSSTSIFPHMHEKFTCTMMLLHNFAVPEWINIKCHEPLVKSVICVDISQENRTTFVASSSKYCSAQLIQNKNRCFFILKTTVNQLQKHLACQGTGLSPFPLSSCENMQTKLAFIFDNVKLSPILNEAGSNIMLFFNDYFLA